MTTPDYGYSTWNIYNMFDDALDEQYDHVFVYNCSYSPSEILKKCDPDAYNKVFANWCKLKGYTKDPSGTFDFIDESRLTQ